jgi:lysophospholipase L1-like esterase
MKKMKLKIKLLSVLILGALAFYSCDDYSEIEAPVQNSTSGSANFVRYVAIGNSLTAGYQSSALYQSVQEYSYPNLIAKQVGLTSFVQPLISDPGIGGQYKIVSLEPFVTKREPIQGGVPLNLSYPAPYGNMGIPGIVLADVMNSVNSAGSYSKSPFIDIVLRGLGTQFAQVKALNPSFITLWIGNNDVLGFATSGGAKPPAPTPSGTFAALYSQLADGLASTGAKVVVANIPSVTAIPFFTTVGPGVAQKLTALQIPGFYYQKHGEYSGSAGATSQLANYSILLTLVSQSYMSDLGKPSGKFWKENNIDISLLIAGGILDTTKVFGLDPKNPIPDALILDDTEISTAAQSVSDFNSTISTIASAKGWGLVDVNAVFNAIRSSDATGGTDFNGIHFSTTFVSGGLFSLDGVHPTSQGQAILANEFLKVINSKFGASIPLIDVGSIPGSLGFAKISLNKIVLPDYDYSMLKNLCF